MSSHAQWTETTLNQSVFGIRQYPYPPRELSSVMMEVRGWGGAGGAGNYQYPQSIEEGKEVGDKWDQEN